MLLDLQIEQTPDQLLTETAMARLVEYHCSGSTFAVVSYPILSVIADVQEREDHLDIFRKSMQDVCDLLSLKYHQPNAEFKDAEVDELVARSVSEVRSILDGTSSFCQHLSPESNEAPDPETIDVMAALTVTMRVDAGSCSLLSETILLQRDPLTRHFVPKDATRA